MPVCFYFTELGKVLSIQCQHTFNWCKVKTKINNFAFLSVTVFNLCVLTSDFGIFKRVLFILRTECSKSAKPLYLVSKVNIYVYFII